MPQHQGNIAETVLQVSLLTTEGTGPYMQELYLNKEKDE